MLYVRQEKKGGKKNFYRNFFFLFFFFLGEHSHLSHPSIINVSQALSVTERVKGDND